jgi:hypothetical protein
MKEANTLCSPHYLTACAVSLCVILALGAAAWRSAAQGPAPEAAGTRRPESEKVLKKSRLPDEPVRIIKVKNKKGELQLGRKFRDEADAGWLRGLTITVENTSGRTITHLTVSLVFPPDANHATAELAYGYDFMFGVSPQDPHYEESRRRQPDRIVRHGERLDLTLSDEHYQHILNVLRNLGYPADLREVLIRIYEVGFDDGTGWLGGGTYDFRGRSQQLKKPPHGRGPTAHSFLRASHSVTTIVPVQSRCGADLHRFYIRADGRGRGRPIRPQRR